MRRIYDKIWLYPMGITMCLYYITKYIRYGIWSSLYFSTTLWGASDASCPSLLDASLYNFENLTPCPPNGAPGFHLGIYVIVCRIKSVMIKPCIVLCRLHKNHRITLFSSSPTDDINKNYYSFPSPTILNFAMELDKKNISCLNNT